jgi:drug/metabolite transporter (DMT)-like permease
MLLATLFFSMVNVCVKFLPRIPAIEIVFFRAAVSFILSVGLLQYYRIPMLGNNRKYLFLRGFFGVFSLILYFYTLQEMPLASAVTIQYISPIFTSILAVYTLGEVMTKRQWVFLFVSFAGVLLIKGIDARVPTFYLLLGIASAAFTSLAYNSVRRLKDTEHPFVVVFYFPLVALPVTAIFTFMQWVQPQGNEWIVILLMGLFTQAAQYCMTRAVHAAELSSISYLNYLGIIYALLFGFVLFDETFEWLALLGMVLVMSGILLNLYNRRTKKTTTPAQTNHEDEGDELPFSE